MHGAEKPAIGDLVFEKSEDPELAEEIVDGEAAGEEKDDNDQAGMSTDMPTSSAVNLRRPQIVRRRDLAKPGSLQKSKR